MKTTMKTLLSLFVSGLLFMACKKDKDADQPKTPKDLLTAKAWKYSGDAKDANGDKKFNETMTPEEACQLDDRIIYKTDNTLSVTRGNVPCNNPDSPLSDQPADGTWELLTNDTQLKIVVRNIPFTSNIIELTESRMVLGYEDGDDFYFEIYEH